MTHFVTYLIQPVCLDYFVTLSLYFHTELELKYLVIAELAAKKSEITNY